MPGGIKKGAVGKPLILSCFRLDGKNKKSLKGVSYGNPALQSGGGHARPGRLEDGTFVTGAIKIGYLFQTRAVLQTDGLFQTFPALKGGGTANVALQAGSGFQTQNTT